MEKSARRGGAGNLTLPVLAFMISGPITMVHAQAPAAAPTAAASQAAVPTDSQGEPLETITITGSLIPQPKSESEYASATPITKISAQDMRDQGSHSVASALQQLSYATGGVQGPETGGYTPAAQTLSMFGLSPMYVKYLVDGRPMSDYPILYGGNDMIASITGVPEQLVDHIDVLPGGQSSLYGSDAIAGLVNIVLKKKLEQPVIDARYGFYAGGGGTGTQFTVADSFDMGTVNILAGVEYQKTDPLWAYQRALTDSYYDEGTSPATAQRSHMLHGSGVYYFEDPNNCANVVSLFNGSERKYTRDGIGDYCGTTRSGYYTLNNSDESVLGYFHLTDDVSAQVQLYGDLLLNHDDVRTGVEPYLWLASVSYGGFYEPSIDDIVDMQHFFAPEEAGGPTFDKTITNSYRAALGAQGTLWAPSWSYDIDLMRIEQKVIQQVHVLWTQPLENFYSVILGPDLGPDPYCGCFPTFTPDYAAFYSAVTPSQYGRFSGYANKHAETSENRLRIQLTNASLMPLPGGPAGLAVALEVGWQGWRYQPDDSFFNGEVYGRGDINGTGSRTGDAATAELRLPLQKWLLFSGSIRYDEYRSGPGRIGQTTYSLGLELHPLHSLLLRGRYGTAFKAPTLADQFQGVSTSFSTLTDYYQCALNGYGPANLDNCPFSGNEVTTSTSGNPKLQPITADVWGTGVVWSPFGNLSISMDYLSWAIANQVTEQDPDRILQTEAFCRLGSYDIHSPTCQAALSQVTRDADEMLVSVFTPKINVANETLHVFTASLRDHIPLGVGTLSLKVSWTDLLDHTYQQYPADTVIDLLRNPIWSQDFKSKINGSVTWYDQNWRGTMYIERSGRTPNNLAASEGYGTPGAATLPTQTIANVSGAYTWRSSLELSVAVDNVFNRMPPADHTYDGTTNSPYNSANYSVYGRSFLLQVTYEFGH